jgi:hypothetical protein
MRHRITARIIAAMAVAGCIAQRAIPQSVEAAAPTAGSRVRITIANHAGARDVDLGRARSAVAHELARIGIDVVWTAERPAGASSQSGAPERTLSKERSLMLVLLSSETGAKLARDSSDQLLGVALRPASRAYLFYARIEEAARQASVSIHEPLSYVMLHEIGHLLLPGGHADLGLMRSTLPKLGVATFRQFTLDQEARLRSATRVRTPRDAPVLTASDEAP